MLEIENLCAGYGGWEVLGNLSLTLQAGRIHALIGPSGCGKSTLLKVLCGIQPPSGGAVLYNGSPIIRGVRDMGGADGAISAGGVCGTGDTRGVNDTAGMSDIEGGSGAKSGIAASGGSGALLASCSGRASGAGSFPRIGYVPQNYGLLDWKTIGQNIFLPLRIGNTRLAGRELAETRLAAGEVIETLGLSEILNRYPREISGGQQQRAALARAFILRPDLLLMDEPFSALDAFTSETSRGLFLALWRKHRVTTLLITHNMHEAAALGQTILLMGTGTAGEDSPHAPVHGHHCSRFLAGLENEGFEGDVPESPGNPSDSGMATARLNLVARMAELLREVTPA